MEYDKLMELIDKAKGFMVKLVAFRLALIHAKTQGVSFNLKTREIVTLVSIEFPKEFVFRTGKQTVIKIQINHFDMG